MARLRPHSPPRRQTSRAINCLSRAIQFEPLEDRRLLHFSSFYGLDDAAVLQAVESFHGSDLAGKDGPMSPIGFDLTYLYEEHALHSQAQPQTAFTTTLGQSLVISGEKVRVELTGDGDVNAFKNQLAGLGMTDLASYGSLVGGTIPITQLDELAGLNSLRFARPSYAPVTAVGLTTSQADTAMRVDEARAGFGVDGSGITVGVLSDSFDTFGVFAADDVASGDLPADFLILQDSFGTDEGRAMAQHIHDLAPGAAIQFATADGGQANFAQNILNLAAAGSDIITDDIRYLDEPFFQDGVVAQAARQVSEQGIPYFSAAFNEGVRSYESAFVDSGETLESGVRLHDFDPGEGVETLQEISLPIGGALLGSFQWDQPFASLGGAGSANDLDISLIGSDRTTVIASLMNNNVGGDPLEVFQLFNDGSIDLDDDGSGDTTFFVRIELVSGAEPGVLKYVDLGRSATIVGFPTDSSTNYGHSNTQGVMGVAASAFFFTPEFGTTPPVLNEFSSRGGLELLFDTQGNRLATPFNPNSPHVTGVDGGNTTFFGTDVPQDTDAFPNFFGTSAAAPHVAAVAALMMQRAGGPQNITVDAIYDALMDTAIDIVNREDPFDPGTTIAIPDGEGFDEFSGHGLVDAVAALQRVVVVSISDLAVLEGDAGTTDMVFSVSLSNIIAEDVTVSYTTVDVTAIAPDDYEAQSGALTFEAGGPLTQFVTVNVVGELLIEPNETFLLQITDISNATLAAGQAVGTILNDDVVASIDDVELLEGNSGTRDMVFSVSLQGTLNIDATISYTTLNGSADAATDYLPRAGLLSFAPLATGGTITVPIVGDVADEGDEQLFVSLVSGQGVRIDKGLGTGTILDGDSLPSLYVSDVQVSNSSGSTHAVFTVALDASSGRTVSVDYNTVAGTATNGIDFVGQGGTLVFGEGVLNHEISVPIIAAAGPTPDKSFFLELSSPLNALLADATGEATITFDAAPSNELIVDNGDAGFDDSGGGWSNLTNTLAEGLDYAYHAAGNGGAAATWSFDSISNGTYEVFAHWIPFVNRANNAPYTIIDGSASSGSNLNTVQVNQQAAPAGEEAGGRVWQSLGTYSINSGTLSVRLTDNANGLVIADAIRLVAQDVTPRFAAIDVAGGNQSIASGDTTPHQDNATEFGQVEMDAASAAHLFTITNTGNANLALHGSPAVVVSGEHAADFVVTSQPATTIQPRGAATFQIQFQPTGSGVRQAMVTIGSNGQNAAPYTFMVQGTGAAPPQAFAHNAAFPADVNADSRVSPFDVLIVINSLLTRNAEPTATPQAASAADDMDNTYYVDVSGDGRLSPFDVLMVINYLLTERAAPSAAPAAVPAASDDGALAAVAVDRAITSQSAPADALVEPLPVEPLPTIQRTEPSRVASTALLADAALGSSLEDDESDEVEFDSDALTLELLDA